MHIKDPEDPSRALIPPAALTAWSVSGLLLAFVDQLENRFPLVCVRGELAAFSRAASGHCYFTLKDAEGGNSQLRTVMFRRQAETLRFNPRDGQLVEVFARPAIYQARGELQLIAEALRSVGEGQLLDAFLRLKERLQAEGLFDAAIKKNIPAHPRAIGVVSSAKAAAWADVQSVLARRVPHIPVYFSAASVQGQQAPEEIMQALQNLFRHASTLHIDVILLVRGGGSVEDLSAFNDEALARTIRSSPVPVICGVGHETDFSIADFVSDLRAATPTAAAEICAVPTQDLQEKMRRLEQRLAQLVRFTVQDNEQLLDGFVAALDATQLLSQKFKKLDTAAMRLNLLDPQRILERGFAWVVDEHGKTLQSCRQGVEDQPLLIKVHDGDIRVRVARQYKLA